ncbi:transport and Golgi organization protein 6 homolog [Rhopilema esculentum]|uniref:transport and Golgi organization protein 6 homolog n=1 Tax=Rhopilema esculentum TaxID=499914 RepID=UPI0031DB8C64
MANGLRVSIMTRGAVDSRHHKQHHQSKLQHDEVPQHSACEQVRMTEDYDVAMKELSDPLLPTRGHAILHLSSLLERGDAKTLGNAEELLPIFLENLSHEDTFIYLASVRAIASLSKSRHRIVIPHLAKEFAMFPDKCNETSKNEQFANGGSKARFRYSPEDRLKIGEALMKAMVSCGPFIAVYSQQVLASLLSGVKDEDNDVRASSLSNAGDLCKLLRFAVHPVIHELMNCISSVLRFEKDVKVRRAAVRVLKLLLDGSGKDIFQVPLFSICHKLQRLALNFLFLSVTLSTPILPVKLFLYLLLLHSFFSWLCLESIKQGKERN